VNGVGDEEFAHIMQWYYVRLSFVIPPGYCSNGGRPGRSIHTPVDLTMYTADSTRAGSWAVYSPFGTTEPFTASACVIHQQQHPTFGTQPPVHRDISYIMAARIPPLELAAQQADKARNASFDTCLLNYSCALTAYSPDGYVQLQWWVRTTLAA